MIRFRGEYIADRKALHNAVRAEAGHRCIRCGHPEGDRMVITKDLDRVLALEAQGWRVFDREPNEEWGVVWSDCDDRCTHEPNGKLRILTVHHLDGHKANNAWWNLLALCQVCHLQVQGKVIPEQPYLWPHTPWFVPYVCGFYAHYYGRQAITREQAEASPDTYLAMGQPWLYTEAA